MARKKQSDEYLTHAVSEEQINVHTDETFPNKKNKPGNSVEEHEQLESANSFIAKKEIGQQTENL